MEMREACFNPGTICADRALGGRDGISSSHVCVDLMIFPSGRVISNGSFVGLIYFTFACGIKKCPVAPASAIPFMGSMFIVPACNP